jgi:hypothetical protein
LHLEFRTFTARTVILDILNEEGGEAIKKQMPNLENRSRMIRWLFLDIWELGGKAFLSAMTDDFLHKKKSPS